MLTLAGVLGFPVEHSLSPAMHNAAFRELGLDWRYVKLPVPPERFEETARALPGSGYRGANVTIPHKLAALEIADEASEAARSIGAANTLTFADGAIRADNTDAGGLLSALAAEHVEPVGMRALVLGAGGAGRAAAWALREAGAGDVAVWNRTSQRAADLARELGVRHAARPEPCELLVNATSVGLRGETDALEDLRLAHLDPPSVVIDLVYAHEGATPVQAWGERAGATVVDGIEVLVRQGALSLQAWTGVRAPLEVMREAALGLTA